MKAITKVEVEAALDKMEGGVRVLSTQAEAIVDKLDGSTEAWIRTGYEIAQALRSGDTSEIEKWVKK